jgi:hypothetical protein
LGYTKYTGINEIKEFEAVRNFLEKMTGKEIEVICEGASISGKVTRIEGNVLHLEKDEVTCYVNIEKIVVLWDSRGKKAHPPGFLPKPKS